MKKLLVAAFAALLKAGCGEDDALDQGAVDKAKEEIEAKKRGLATVVPKAPVVVGEELSAEDIEKLLDEADALFEQGKYPEVKAKMTWAYAAFEKLKVKDRAQRVALLRLLCITSVELGENDKAIEYAAEVMSHAENDDDRGFAYHELGNAYLAEAKLDEAIGYLGKALAVLARALGPEQPAVAHIHSSLGAAYYENREYDKAIVCHKRSLAIYSKALGPEHYSVGQSYNELGLVYTETGELDEAIRCLEKSLMIKLKTLHPEHPRFAITYTNLGLAYDEKGEHDKAIAYHEKALAIDLKAFGPEHPNVANTYCNMGTAYAYKGDKAKAKAYLLKAEAIQMMRLGPRHPSTKNTQKWIDSLK